MKYDNPFIKRNIVKSVEKNYGIKTEIIDFISVGEESYAYIISDRNKSKYFAKYCEEKHAIDNIDMANQLLLRLKHLDFVVPPIEVNNKTFFTLLKGKLYLFPYIEGKNITLGNHEWDEHLTSKAVDIMVKIHGSTKLVDFKLPREQFKNHYIKRLNRLLDLIKTKVVSDKKINQLLKGNEAFIRRVIDQHTKVGKKYKKLKEQFVLTHGDITGLNIIDTGTSLKLVDWDGAMFAPAERDINFFSSNPHFSIEDYFEKTGKDQCSQELRDYYGQQWSLDSIIGNFETLLSEKSKYVDRKESIKEIEEYLGYCK